jgi:hypothetical protein
MRIGDRFKADLDVRHKPDLLPRIVSLFFICIE